MVFWKSSGRNRAEGAQYLKRSARCRNICPKGIVRFKYWAPSARFRPLDFQKTILVHAASQSLFRCVMIWEGKLIFLTWYRARSAFWMGCQPTATRRFRNLGGRQKPFTGSLGCLLECRRYRCPIRLQFEG